MVIGIFWVSLIYIASFRINFSSFILKIHLIFYFYSFLSIWFYRMQTWHGGTAPRWSNATMIGVAHSNNNSRTPGGAAGSSATAGPPPDAYTASVRLQNKINEENAQMVDRQMKNILRKRQLLLIFLVR